MNFQVNYSLIKGWSYEELFGVKRWRNDSPFMKEYIRVDNQLMLIIALIVLLSLPMIIHYHRQTQKYGGMLLTSDLGKFGSNDLI